MLSDFAENNKGNNDRRCSCNNESNNNNESYTKFLAFLSGINSDIYLQRCKLCWAELRAAVLKPISRLKLGSFFIRTHTHRHIHTHTQTLSHTHT